MSVQIARHSDDGFIITVFDRKSQNWIAVATTPDKNLAEQIAKVFANAIA
jgi:K+/H+ antiporter YhaU regulatory subunit KhtT